jgi:putative protease
MGPSTGVVELTVPEIRVDLEPVESCGKGTFCSIPLGEAAGGEGFKLRRGDKVYLFKETAQ